MNQSQISSEFWQEAFQGFEIGIEKGIGIFVFALIEAAKQFWFSYWLYIIMFFVVISAGMVLQILMLREGRHNKLPVWFNRLVGSVFYFIFLILITATAYLIFGSEIIDKTWIALFGTMAFAINWLFLRAIGFWHY